MEYTTLGPPGLGVGRLCLGPPGFGVGRLCLGTLSFGGNWSRTLGRDESRAPVERVTDLGVNSVGVSLSEAGVESLEASD